MVTNDAGSMTTNEFCFLGTLPATSPKAADDNCDLRVRGAGLELRSGEGLVLHPFPEKPPRSPNWDRLVAHPSPTGISRGMTLRLGGWVCTWVPETEPVVWRSAGDGMTLGETVLSFRTNPEPFAILCGELAAAGSTMESGWKGDPEKLCSPSPVRLWPPLIYARWLRILLDSRVTEVPVVQGVWTRLPMRYADASLMLRKLRLGVFVAAALTAPEELPPVLEVLEQFSGVEPSEISWESLPHML